MGLVILEQFRKINLMKSISYEMYFLLTSVDWVWHGGSDIYKIRL